MESWNLQKLDKTAAKLPFDAVDGFDVPSARPAGAMHRGLQGKLGGRVQEHLKGT